MSPEGTGVCPRCGGPVECGARSGSCWCQLLPSVPHPATYRREQSPEQAKCLCPACLKECLSGADSPGRITRTGSVM
ncbi:MAG TPA: cysteine-rich CWC family protein [Actinomycetota bacterium]